MWMNEELGERERDARYDIIHIFSQSEQVFSIYYCMYVLFGKIVMVRTA